jgi:hypothetical protein
MRHVPSGKIGGSLFLSFLVSGPAYAEAPDEKSKRSSPKSVELSLTSSHGKTVYTDYTVIGMSQEPYFFTVFCPFLYPWFLMLITRSKLNPDNLA